MNSREAYCTKQSKFVRVTLDEQPDPTCRDGTTIPTVVCLNHSRTCAGPTCPVTGVSPTLMALRLMRHNSTTGRSASNQELPDAGDEETAHSRSTLP